MKNQQLSLKPQDLVVLLKLICSQDEPFTYSGIAKALFISASEVHASLARARIARLVTANRNDSFEVARDSFRELLLHGAQFVFPAITGSLTRGIPTAHAGPALRDLLIESNEPPPVWPYSEGSARGITLHPLYPTVPHAAEGDSRLYEALTLFDAIRIGRAREREIALGRLTKLLT